MAKSVYDIIKKQNGEGFTRVLRDKGLLDIPNIAHIVKYAGRTATDAEQIFSYLWSLKEFNEIKDTTNNNPFQLLDTAGYHAFEVQSLDEQNSIRRFFRPGEELCTFNDEHRYQDYYMIHAIKHNVWRDPYAIKPSKNPERQDEYGTSVISIQIRKDGGFISIKNRYNHNVTNPDQTFDSNPDNIIPGLATALKKHFDVDWQSTGYLPNGFVMMNNQVLKIDFEHNNNYIGNGFYTQNGSIIKIDKSCQIQMDYFIWDNNARRLLNPLICHDGFIRAFSSQVYGKTIRITGKSPNQTIMADDIKIIELKDNQIFSLNLPDVTTIKNDFLNHNLELRQISLPRVTEIGRNFIIRNEKLQKISLPSVKTIGDSFMYHNAALQEISLPNVISIGYNFLPSVSCLHEIYMPLVKTIEDFFLIQNAELEKISLPNVTMIGSDFLHHNQKLREISLPNVISIGDSFLSENIGLQNISLPCAKLIGDYFLMSNKKIETVSLPKAINIGSNFLFCAEKLQEISLPCAKTINSDFLFHNKNLRKISLPKATSIGSNFLYANLCLQEISLPQILAIGYCFLYTNKKLEKAHMPNVTTIGDNFLSNNENLNQISLPVATMIGKKFLLQNKILQEISLQSVTTIGEEFLSNNKMLQEICLPEMINIGDKFLAGNTTVIISQIPQQNTDAKPEYSNIEQRFESEKQKLRTYIHTNNGRTI